MDSSLRGKKPHVVLGCWLNCSRAIYQPHSALWEEMIELGGVYVELCAEASALAYSLFVKGTGVSVQARKVVVGLVPHVLVEEGEGEFGFNVMLSRQVI